MTYSLFFSHMPMTTQLQLACLVSYRGGFITPRADTKTRNDAADYSEVGLTAN